MNTQQRKTHLLFTFFALLLSVPMTLLTSCSDDDNNVIIDKEITLNVGEVYYTGSDGVWKSDNKYIASATYNTINANRAGETVIRSNSSNIKVKVVATNFNYEEPILAFGESNDSIKNAMAAYEIKNETTTNSLEFKGTDNIKEYLYDFKDKGKTLIRASFIVDNAYWEDLNAFLQQRYMPIYSVPISIPIDDNNWSMTIMADPTLQTEVIVLRSSSEVYISYSPYSDSTTNVVKKAKSNARKILRK